MDGEQQDVSSFLKSWGWKREHRTERERFRKPYIHKMHVPDETEPIMLTIEQAAFKDEGFASTIWDRCGAHNSRTAAKSPRTTECLEKRVTCIVCAS